MDDPRIWFAFFLTTVVLGGLGILFKCMGPPDRFNKKKT